MEELKFFDGNCAVRAYQNIKSEYSELKENEIDICTIIKFPMNFSIQ